MKLYIIAGEASGDLHGSNLVKALKKRRNDLEIRAWGGDLMQAQGAEIVKHYKELAFMGFVEVVANLRTILKNMAFAKQDIAAHRPDALILIDYPGFNMRIGEWAHEQGIKVLYYISPQVWAWKKGRTHKLKKFVDRMYVILPFEKDFYKQYNYDVEFVGHPLLDTIGNYTRDEEEFRHYYGLDKRPIITLAPGSRKQEISRMLPMMHYATRSLKDYQVLIAGTNAHSEAYYLKMCTSGNPQVIFGATAQLFKYSYAGLVTSGTATLEAALYGMPQVVCYEGGWLSYQIAKRLVDLEYISLVNLIANKEIVKELIQGNFNLNNIEIELGKILQPDVQKRMKANYKDLRELLGGAGASDRTAESMLKILEGTRPNG